MDLNYCQHCPFSLLLKSWASCISTSCKLASPHFIENEWSKANSRICTFGGLQTFRLSSQVDCQLFPLDWKANIKLIPLHKNCKCCFQVWKTRQETLVQREALFLSTQGWVNRMKWPIKWRLCGQKKGLVAKCHLIRPPSKASKCHSLWYHRYERYPQNVQDKIGHGLHLKSFTLILAKINWQSCDVWFGPPLLCFWSSKKTWMYTNICPPFFYKKKRILGNYQSNGFQTRGAREVYHGERRYPFSLFY